VYHIPAHPVNFVLAGSATVKFTQNTHCSFEKRAQSAYDNECARFFQRVKRGLISYKKRFCAQNSLAFYFRSMGLILSRTNQ